MDTRTSADPAVVSPGPGIIDKGAAALVPGPVDGSGNPDWRAAQIRYGERLRKAICTIAEAEGTSSQASTIITGFCRFIAPSLATQGQAHFPVTIRYHHRTRSRSTGRAALDNLFFIIGAAVLDFYDVKNQWESLEERLQQLEEIAEDGFHRYRVYGTEDTGFTLMLK